MLVGIEVVRDRETLERFDKSDHMTSRILSEAMQRDLFFYPGGTGDVRDILCLGPPLNIAESDISRIVEAIRESIAAVRTTF